MKVFSVLITLLIFSLHLTAQPMAYGEPSAPASRAGLDIYLHFSSPRDEVLIENGKLTHIATTYIYDENRPWAATPVDMSRRTVADAVPLNGHQLKALEEVILNSGIMQLPRQEYGAPAGQRSYDYQFRIRSGGQSRAVIYRSNPSYAVAPPAFGRMKEYVWKLVTEVGY